MSQLAHLEAFLSGLEGFEERKPAVLSVMVTYKS